MNEEGIDKVNSSSEVVDENYKVKTNETSNALNIISIILVVCGIVGVGIGLLIGDLIVVALIIFSTLVIVPIMKGLAEIIQLLENRNNKN